MPASKQTPVLSSVSCDSPLKIEKADRKSRRKSTYETEVLAKSGHNSNDPGSEFLTVFP
jgi:hypothetical protein